MPSVFHAIISSLTCFIIFDGLPTTAGLALTKLAFNQSFDNNFEDQLYDEELYQERASNTYDYKEGVQAFLEKRKPNFKGE